MTEWRALTFWLAFVGLSLAAIALVLSHRTHRKDRALRRGVRTLQTMVSFLQAVNALPPGLLDEELQSRMMEELRRVLAPFSVHPRLWIANPEWNTLHGVGE